MTRFAQNAVWALPCALLFFPAFSHANTIITNTRAEVSFMAALWETDTVGISPLANAQYPQFTNDWNYIFPHSSLSDDLDIHIDLAVDSSGYGSTNNNTGASSVVAEVINATISQLNDLRAISGSVSRVNGIFRFWTEHASERHFELHPVTALGIWNGTDYSPAFDYRPNIKYVADGATHPNSVLVALLNGSQTVTASILSDNEHVAFTYPSPSVNYVQYAGLAASPLLSDSVSSYFLLRPSLVPTAIVKCRIPAGTVAAAAATSLASNQIITVNALTRTDLLSVSNQLTLISAGQSTTFPRPVELITLGIGMGGTPSNPPVILVGWDVSTLAGGVDNYGPSPFGPTTIDANLSVVGLTRGDGIGTSYTAAAGAWGGIGFTAGSADNAILFDQFITFSITPNSGYNVSFSSIPRFDYYRSLTGPPNGVLQFSVGAGDFIDVTNLVYPVAGSGASFGAIDLSGITALQNVSTDVTFRLLNFGGGTRGSWYIYDTLRSTAADLVLQGVVTQVLNTNAPAAAPTLTLPSFTNHQFTFSVTGTPGTNYVIETATNLPNSWVPVVTNPAPFTFNLDNTASNPKRFFRAVYLP